MTAGVTVAYLIPDGGPPGQSNLDKLAHLAAFAAIGLATWPATGRPPAFLRLLMVGLALSIGLEFLQEHVPGRHFSTLDVLANVVGLALGASTAGGLERAVVRSVSAVRRVARRPRYPRGLARWANRVAGRPDLRPWPRRGRNETL